MNPVIALPIHDPDGVMLTYLAAITPQLRDIFARAFVSISPATKEPQAALIAQLQADPFFYVNFNKVDTQAGDHFMAACQRATEVCPPAQVVQICGVDRVAFALNSEHQDQFIRDIRAVGAAQTPLLFQRSQAAWETHPSNYREFETMITRAGEMLFGQTLDFAWCQLAVTVAQLQRILPQFTHHDMSALAEFILLLRDEIKTQDVDWLAWEDPFIYGRDPVQMKCEREESLAEMHKRLGYSIPKLQLLLNYSKKMDASV